MVGREFRGLGRAQRWGLIGSAVILNAVKNLSGCNNGRAIPEILRFAQDDRCSEGWCRARTLGNLRNLVSLRRALTLRRAQTGFPKLSNFPKFPNFSNFPKKLILHLIHLIPPVFEGFEGLTTHKVLAVYRAAVVVQT